MSRSIFVLFDSPTGGIIWLTNACCDCFAFCKNICG
jgi:hypothetical protein